MSNRPVTAEERQAISTIRRVVTLQTEGSDPALTIGYAEVICPDDKVVQNFRILLDGNRYRDYVEAFAVRADGRLVSCLPVATTLGFDELRRHDVIALAVLGHHDGGVHSPESRYEEPWAWWYDVTILYGRHSSYYAGAIDLMGGWKTKRLDAVADVVVGGESKSLGFPDGDAVRDWIMRGCPPLSPNSDNLD